MPKLGSLIDELLSLFFQTTCHTCGRVAGPRPLCATCLRDELFWPVEPPWCELCGASVQSPLPRCGACLIRRRVPLVAVRSLFWLSEADRRLVHKIKYARRFELMRLWYPPFLESFEVWFPADVTVIPVPLHRSGWHRRGFNQAEWLSRWIAFHARLPLETEAFRKLHASRSQARLSRVARAANLSHHFGWRSRRSSPRKVLLVDDVYTTGATLRACARALRQAGTREVFGWTLFRTPKFFPAGSSGTPAKA